MRGDDTLRPPGRQRAPQVEPVPDMTQADRASIERFVRGTLGCGCPDEVFEHVAISRLPAIAGRPPIAQLLVGSRLLIHVVAPPHDASAGGWIEQLAANGRAARDRHGYHRFRLVIAAPAAVAASPELRERFARAVVGDEKAHLHFVGDEPLPAGLDPAPSAAG